MNGRRLLPFLALFATTALACTPVSPYGRSDTKATEHSNFDNPETAKNPDESNPSLFSDDLRLQAATATVRIANVPRKSSGSGVIVGSKAGFLYILTADHVVAGSLNRLDISLFPTGILERDALVLQGGEVLAHSAGSDLALIRLPTEKPAPALLPLCSPTQIPDGTDFPALSIGCQSGKPTTEQEVVKSKRTIEKKGEVGTQIVFETVGRPDHGRSGGPLIDRAGRVIGICSGIGDEKGYYIHPQMIHIFLRDNNQAWLLHEAKQP